MARNRHLLTQKYSVDVNRICVYHHAYSSTVLVLVYAVADNGDDRKEYLEWGEIWRNLHRKFTYRCNLPQRAPKNSVNVINPLTHCHTAAASDSVQGTLHTPVQYNPGLRVVGAVMVYAGKVWTRQ